MVPYQPIIIAQKENGTIQSYIEIWWSEFYQLESVDVALAELGKDYNIMSKLDA